MKFIIRDIDTSDLDAVLSLNQSEVPHVGDADLEKMAWFSSHATYFRVASNGDELAAFLIGLRPGTQYASPNYRWFCERYGDFAYVDRVAVSPTAQRHGLASRLYDDFAHAVPASVRLMTCEVNIKPPNEISMQFHENLGFRQVGSRQSDGGAKEVAMLAKDLRQ